MDGLKQPPSGFVELLGGVVVGQSGSLGLELGQGNTGFEKGVGIGQRGQFLQGRHDQPLGVAFLYLALAINGVLGKQAGPVEVEVGVDVRGTEVVDLLRKTLRDVAVAEALAYDSAVLGLRQAVVVRMARARFGELDAELFQQAGDPGD